MSARFQHRDLEVLSERMTMTNVQYFQNGWKNDERLNEGKT